MKRILLAGATLLALTAAQPTLAADAPVYKGPAPVAIVPYNWTGFYVGGHVGGIWGSVDDLHILPLLHADPKPSGWIGGVLGGWNYQAGSLVFGIEADAGWGKTTGSNTFDGHFDPVNINFTGNIRGRLGLAMDRVLFFVAGGAAFANVEINHVGPPDSTVSQSFTGWTIGGGIDWAATNNFILRVEYLYASGFGNQTYGFFAGTDPHPVALNNISTVRGAAIWKF